VKIYRIQKKDGCKRKNGKKKRGCLYFLKKTFIIFILLLIMLKVFETVSEITVERIERREKQSRTEILKATGEEYPEELLELAQNNPEAMDFVLHYPKKKDGEFAETIGSWREGELPFLLQWDERWGYAEYGSSMIAVTGCGPTCLSMVACGLTGDDSITPVVVAEYAMDNGYYEKGAGTSWSLMTEGAKAFGIKGEVMRLDRNTVFKTLENDIPIVCSMRPGDFTTSGHFIVLTGTEDGMVKVHDPNSRIKSDKLWEYEVLSRQINNLWAFSLLDS